MDLTARQYIMVVATPIIVVFGLVGNSLTMAVLSRKRFRSRSITIYLIALAVADSVFLLSNTMVSQSVKILTGVDIQALSNWGCKVSKYVLMTSRAISAWLIVILTVERLLAMSIPHIAHVLSTKKRAFTSTAGVVVMVCVVYSYIIYCLVLQEEWDICYWKTEIMEQKLMAILNLGDLLFYCLVPSVILATCNSILIYMLFYSEELRKEATKTSSRDHATIESRSIAVVLALMSGTFVVLTMPLSIYQIIYTSGIQMKAGRLFYPILYSLDILNHAVNFLLYCISGPSFRAEIRDMICGKCRRNTTASTEKRRDTPSTQETRVNGFTQTKQAVTP